MNDGTEQIRASLKMHMMGERYRAGYARAEPIGDRMINAVRDAIWEAWELGLESEGQSIYPTIPLLDGVAVELEEPEI